MIKAKNAKPVYYLTGNLAFKSLLTVLLLVSLVSMLVFGLALYHAERVGVYSSSRAEIEQERMENITTGLSYEAFYANYSYDGHQKETIIAPATNQLQGTDFYYAIYDESGQLLAGWQPDFDPLWQSELVVQNKNGYYTDDGSYVDFAGQPYTVKGYLDGAGSSKDEIYWNVQELDFLFGWSKLFPWLFAVSFLLAVSLTVLLAISAGRRTGQTEIARRRFDRLPLDLLLGLAAVAFYYLLYLALELLWFPVSNYYYYALYNRDYYPLYAGYRRYLSSTLAGFISLAGAVLLLELCFVTLVVRLKTKTLLQESLLYRFIWRPLVWLAKKALFLLTSLPLVWKSGLLIIGWILFDLFITEASIYWWRRPLLFFASKLVLAAGFLFLASGFTVIRQGTKELVSGRLDHQIKTDHLVGELKTHAGELNQIGLGMATAVEEKLKSERFRTELITNVSHDLKTPLTSIVNYVDLLQNHADDPAKVQEYLTVLERHSQRLKKLTEDLVDASKAVTGNIQLKLAPVDAGVFLAQLAGEYTERFAAADLQLVVEEQLPEKIYILADGRQLWRILDNLLENSCKYGQTATRVYLDLAVFSSRLEITLKNISRAPLNISAEALQERFVRGDESRSSEGSGLGISIAKSLCELQGATLDLTIDGDLFKVTLTFPRTFAVPDPVPAAD